MSSAVLLTVSRVIFLDATDVKLLVMLVHSIDCSLVSDIAIFVLKRDVKLQLTRLQSGRTYCQLEWA